MIGLTNIEKRFGGRQVAGALDALLCLGIRRTSE